MGNAAEYVAFCGDERFRANPRIMDACFMPIYSRAANEQKHAIVDVRDQCGVLAQYGATCQVERNRVVWVSKFFPEFACDETICPRKTSTSAVVVPISKNDARQHHPDGH